MRIWKKCVLFYVGGAAYLFLELLFRGRSYGSMFLAGGICFLLIGHLGHVEPKLNLTGRMLAGSMIVTAVELAAGMLVNRNYQVWDYRNQPLNFKGQNCPQFTVLWIPLSLLAIYLYSFLEIQMETKMSPA